MIWVYKIAHIIVLSVRAKAGRRSAKYAFTHYDPSFSGWGDVWTFFIGFLPAAYVSWYFRCLTDPRPMPHLASSSQ